MLRQGPAAGRARRHDLLVRVHVLRAMRERPTQRNLSELQRRVCAETDPSGATARKISAVDNKAPTGESRQKLMRP
jgi:hypothetical protein